jgi:hypothetical protein
MNPNPIKGEALPPSHPLLRTEENTFAANPARLRIKAWLWLSANPGVFFILAAAILSGAVASFFKPLIGAALILSGIFVGFLTVRSARKKFLIGAVCPGVILSTEDGLVAVFTDLKTSSGAFRPAVKIVRQPLHRFAAEEIYDGMRVATVATFHGGASAPAWKNFSPEVIGCVVRNDELVTRSFESISEDQWQAMEVYLSRVTQKNPGLYRS